MNSKKARAIRKEARKFANISGMKYSEVYKEIKKTAKGIPINQNNLD